MREERKKRAEEMKELKLKNMSLQQIGDFYGLTREAVRLILLKHFGLKHRKTPKTFHCLVCNKPFGENPRKLCSKECSRVHQGLPRTDEEMRLRRNKRALDGYYKRKQLPGWKETVRKYNQNYLNKLKKMKHETTDY